MNKPAMIKAMTASISEVLEQMFFLPVDMIATQGEDTDNVPGRNTIAAMVGFNGRPSGTFQLNVPADLATSITADFLGTVPEQLSTEQVTGTVKEMINMLAGNSLSAYDAGSPFDLQIPELVEAPTGNGADKIGEESIDIGIETLDSRMTLHMTAQQSNSTSS